MIKQDELTQLNRDNARLLSEAQQQLREQRVLQQQLDHKASELDMKQTAYAQSEQQRQELLTRCELLERQAVERTKKKTKG